MTQFRWCPDRQQRVGLAVCYKCKKECYNVAVQNEYLVAILGLPEEWKTRAPLSTVNQLAEDYWKAVDGGLTPRIEIRRVQVYEEEE